MASTVTTPSVLDGLRVLDASDGVAGPLASMFLADFGADVIKIEPAGGAAGRADPAFAVWNRGKRSMVADLGSEAGRSRVAELLRDADVCVASGPVSALADGPLDPAAATAAHPRLVFLHTPPYTDDAPWAGAAESEGLLAAATGVALRQSSFDGGPVDSIYPHMLTVQGMWGAACVVAALHERESSGLGQLVTVAGVHGMMIAAAGALTFDPTAVVPARRGGNPGGSVPFYRTYRCADGEWLFLAALTPQFTALAFGVLGVDDLLEDPRLEGAGRAGILRPENLGWVTDRMAAVFASKPRAEWLELLHAAGCPAGPLLRREAWLDHPQLAAIGMRVDVDDPERGPVVMPGVPIQLTASPGAVRGPAPPLPDSNSEPNSWRFPVQVPETAESSGWDGRERPMGSGPLEGIRVLDLGAIIAGPFAASLLAELGVDVIKVEPLTGDSFRGPGFAAYNKGQRGVALDLRQAAGRDAFLRLAATADVVLDNYRPGVLGRLGIDYESLRSVNPRIITLSVTGFGEGGPLGEEPGFDPVLQAMSGMMTAQGGDSDPVFFTVPVDDVAAAASGALTVALAVLHRDRTGAGQRTWTSLAAMSAMLQTSALVRWEGRPPAAVGGRDFLGPAEDDRYVASGEGWSRVRGGARVVTRPTAELAADAELLAYGVLHPDPRPGRAGWWTAGRHAHFSRSERSGTLVAPGLGQHTREVLADVGLSMPDIDGLLRSGAALQAAVDPG